MDSDAVDSIADGVDRRLDPRVIPLQRTLGWIPTAILGSISLFVITAIWAASEILVLGLLLVPLWLLGVVALAWQFQRWPAIAYRFASYRIDELGIEIRRGVVWRRVINVPKSRVQHTDVSQGPLERGSDLGTLVIFTAGTQFARVQLSGLPYADALRIRDHLLPGGADDAV